MAFNPSLFGWVKNGLDLRTHQMLHLSKLIVYFIEHSFVLQVFWICIMLLEVAYGVALLVGASSSFLWSRYITVANCFVRTPL